MRDGAPIHGNTRLEVVWVTIPFLMVTALAIYGWIVLDDIEAKQPNELVVNVTGQQFTWTLRVPRGEGAARTSSCCRSTSPVDFRINTKDVLHSFWVPEFRLKSDAVPGLTTKIRLTPDRVGGYQVVCAELCGLGHSTMRQLVRVVAEPRASTPGWRRRRQRAAAARAAGTVGRRRRRHGRRRRQRPWTARRSSPPPAAAAATRWPRPGTNGDVGPKLDQISNADEAYIKESIEDPSADRGAGLPRRHHAARTSPTSSRPRRSTRS